MYRVVRASTLYYENFMRGTKSRYNLVKPFLLLVDTTVFEKAKAKMTEDYLNLCDIVTKMKALYVTGESQYHHFGMLLKEFQILGFDVNAMKASNATPTDRLKDQIDLLLQFLSYRYPFDEYDNKIGVHDLETDQFIFVQP
ncbi:MAG: hypothetical protein MJB12_05390 [Firmicutes bacterium]|nr:hypothetical protein [Bacillota bacterium]